MTDPVREREPRVIAVGHYVNDDESEGTSIHLRPDAGSFDFHTAELARAIDTGWSFGSNGSSYGRPSAAVVERLSRTFDVRVKAWADGFSRIVMH